MSPGKPDLLSRRLSTSIAEVAIAGLVNFIQMVGILASILSIEMTTSMGATALAAQEPVIPVGEYSTLHQDGEHCSGYCVDLWRFNGAIHGLFHACAGMVGDMPTGVIERQSYDAKTGRLSFEVRLTLGSDYLGGGRQVPSQDLFSFTGRLSPTELVGTLEKTDKVYADDNVSKESVRLPKQRTLPPAYDSFEQWQGKINELLKVSGPKW
jgi:hypothetical protein